LAEKFGDAIRFDQNKPIENSSWEKNMDYGIAKKLGDVAHNKYEAIIVAARVARNINAARVAAAEQSGVEPEIQYMSKVTSEALKELATGKVKFKYREDTTQTDELFPQ
jgi:DNA-directed RNA polymerase omega subunit